MGHGTAYPGEFLLKLDKNILSYFKMPEITIFVTGTTGKTSVSGTIAQVLERSHKKVGHNTKGSNLKEGVISTLLETSKLNGKSKVDVLVIEIDERYVKEIFKEITPTYFVINNLSRDQLARNGHADIVFREINNSIDQKTHLILNADDPLVVKFSFNKKNQITYYGLSKTNQSTMENNLNTLDQLYCPNCDHKLIFDYFHYGNLGNYHCSNCKFERPHPKYEAILTDSTHFQVDDQTIEMGNEAIYNIYNLLATYTTASLVGVSPLEITNTLNQHTPKVKRFHEYQIEEKHVITLLSKNETPLSYNQSIEYIQKQPIPKSVIIGFTRISGRYDLKDLSWLYDINFELLKEETITDFTCVGPFAYDIATRLKIAGIEEEKIHVHLPWKDLVDTIKITKEKEVYAMLYFDLDYYLVDVMKKVKQ